MSLDGLDGLDGRPSRSAPHQGCAIPRVEKKTKIVFFSRFCSRPKTDIFFGLFAKNRPKPTDIFFFFFLVFFGVGFASRNPTETDRRFGEKPKNQPSLFSFSVHSPGNAYRRFQSGRNGKNRQLAEYGNRSQEPEPPKKITHLLLKSKNVEFPVLLFVIMCCILTVCAVCAWCIYVLCSAQVVKLLYELYALHMLNALYVLIY